MKLMKNEIFDGDRESDDSWHIGYEVEMRGTGIEEYADSEGICKFLSGFSS